MEVGPAARRAVEFARLVDKLGLAGELDVDATTEDGSVSSVDHNRTTRKGKGKNKNTLAAVDGEEDEELLGWDWDCSPTDADFVDFVDFAGHEHAKSLFRCHYFTFDLWPALI